MTGISTSAVPWEAEELATWLTDGKPEVGWRGDPRLSLQIGVIERGGRIVARRYEVWRHNEDGTDSEIGTWRMEEFPTILTDLIQMDPRTPGHKSMLDRIDEHNAALDKAKADEFRDHYGAMVEHAANIRAHRVEGRHQHFLAEETAKAVEADEGKGYKVTDRRASAE